MRCWTGRGLQLLKDAPAGFPAAIVHHHNLLRPLFQKSRREPRKYLIRIPDQLVLGVRDLTLPQVPAKSKVGNRLTSWAFRTLYGPRLGDTEDAVYHPSPEIKIRNTRQESRTGWRWVPSLLL